MSLSSSFPIGYEGNHDVYHVVRATLWMACVEDRVTRRCPGCRPHFLIGAYTVVTRGGELRVPTGNRSNGPLRQVRVAR